MKNFISIPKPCHEDWDNMTPVEQGRHCDKCNLVVKDFREMSNEEIIQFFEGFIGFICGRVRNDQLNAPLNLTDKLKKFLYVLALVFLPFVPYTGTALSNKTELNSIQGKTMSQSGNLIPFAIISAHDIYGNKIAFTKSDIDGNFLFKYPINAKEIKIIAAGFMPTIKPNKPNNLKLKNYEFVLEENEPLVRVPEAAGGLLHSLEGIKKLETERDINPFK